MIDAVFREEWSRLVAYLCGLFRDVDVAEEAAQEAFEAAARHWPREGLPDNPRAWLRTTARRRAIDALRRARRVVVGLDEGELEELPSPRGDARHPSVGDHVVPDDRLELIFACCHPALARDAQVALVLRSLIGLSTAEIARTFLVSEETMKRRLTRAKAKVRRAGIPFHVPSAEDVGDRLETVLTVVYLIFNAGYGGREDLADQAIWLSRVLSALLPEAATIHGLLALMLFHQARRDARSAGGRFVPLPEQDRALWNREMIREAQGRLDLALRDANRSAYVIQAQIAAEYCKDRFDWQRIVALYTELQRLTTSDIVTLNKAVAVSEAESPETALRMLEDLELDEYPYLHSTRAELLQRMGRLADARAEFARARELAVTDLDRAFPAERLAHLSDHEP